MSSLVISIPSFGTLTLTVPSVLGEIQTAVITVAPATITMDLGTPGPQGIPGPQGPQGEPGQSIWGEITGTLSNQTDLQSALDAKQSVSGMSAYLTKAGNLSGLENLYVARANLNLATTDTPVFGGIDVEGSGGNYAHLTSTSLSLIQPGHGQFLIQPSQGIVWPDASVQTTAWNDAPSDGTIYGRQDGNWVEAGGGDYLPLAGGAMDANATVSFSDGTNDSLIGGWGFGVEQTGNSATFSTVEPGFISVHTDANNYTNYYSYGVRVTADGGSKYAYLDSSEWLKLIDNNGDKQTIVSPGKIEIYEDPPSGLPNFTIDGTSITFPDATVQSTAAIGDAPADEIIYGRKNNGWMAIPSTVAWGDITGTIGDQTDLGTALGLKANLSSPTFTGDPRAPTPANSDNDTSIATTAFVKNQGYLTSAPVTSVAGRTGAITLAVADVSGAAPLASPSLTGTPLAPTATTGDSSTQIATTAFVQGAIIAGSAHAETLQATVRNNTGATLNPFTVVYINGALGNNATVAKAQANAESTSSGTFAITESSISNNADGIVISAGVLSNVDTSAFTDGDKLYLSPTVAGGVTTTKPSAPNHLVYVGVVTRSHPTLGTVSVRIQNGYELDELHDVAIASKTDNDLLAYESSTSLWKNKSFSTLGLLTSATASTTYAPLASPTFTGTVTIPSGASISGFATLASPSFSGTPSLPTGTTAVTQTAGNNTTALATTAFVTAAVPAFATNAQTLTGTSTTTALNPLTNYIGSLNPAHYSPDVAQLSSTLTGTGSASSANANGYSVQLGSTAGSYATRSQTLWPNRVAVTGNLQWTRPVGFSARIAVYNRMDANAQFGISFGQATATLATPTVRSIGCYFAASAANTPGVLVLEVHDGTNYYTVNSSYTPTFNLLFDVECYSDGAGNAYLYVNGSQVATSANAPSTNGGTTYQTVLQIGYKATGTPTGTSNSVFQCLKFLTN